MEKNLKNKQMIGIIPCPCCLHTHTPLSQCTLDVFWTKERVQKMSQRWIECYSPIFLFIHFFAFLFVFSSSGIACIMQFLVAIVFFCSSLSSTEKDEAKKRAPKHTKFFNLKSFHALMRCQTDQNARDGKKERIPIPAAEYCLYSFVGTKSYAMYTLEAILAQRCGAVHGGRCCSVCF